MNEIVKKKMEMILLNSEAVKEEELVDHHPWKNKEII